MSLKTPGIQLSFGLLALIISARISFAVPIFESTIPITGQTLGVILVSYFLGGRLGLFAVFSYLILGGLGLPIFANGNSGWAVFSEGSGGFLIGFLVAAIFIHWLKKIKLNSRIIENALVNVGATTIIILCGLLGLTRLYDVSKAIDYGFFPFWKGAVIKIIIGFLIIYIYQNFKRKDVKI